MAKLTDNSVSAQSGEQCVEGISEITILPDGRVYVLGYSQAIRETMEQADLVSELPRMQQPLRHTEPTDLEREDHA